MTTKSSDPVVTLAVGNYGNITYITKYDDVHSGDKLFFRREGGIRIKFF